MWSPAIFEGIKKAGISFLDKSKHSATAAGKKANSQ
jgi:hypothetical protein